MYPEVMKRVVENVTLEEMEHLATDFVRATMKCNVIVLKGEMGAGKTTMVKAMGKALGVTDAISSPTFSIVNEYQTITGELVYHFDFYRLKNEAEAYDIGTEEYFDSGRRCFVEWSEKIPTLLPAQRAEITIEIVDATHRTIALEIHE